MLEQVRQTPPLGGRELIGYLWIAQQVLLVAALAGLTLVALGNMRELRRLGEHPAPERLPPASILVPARNEEASIDRCVRSLLAQDYPDYEVLVLDDSSEDGTGAALARLAAEDPRLTVLAGEPLPRGWLGKNWACHQLAQRARGQLLLFTDADTCHHPRALADAVATLEAHQADLLTAFPRQEAVSWPERLLVPGLIWTFFVLVPLRLAHRSPRPRLSVTSGQFMLFRRSAYEAIGGHEAVRQEVAEDMVLGWRIKALGLRWRAADGSLRVCCRMYRSLRSALDGFGKNLFAGFGYNLPAYIAGWLLAAVLVLEPLVVLALRLAGVPIAPLSTVLAAAAVGNALVLMGMLYPRFNFPRYLALLYPLTLLAVIVVAGYSLALALSGRTTWKGRRIERPRIRWR